MLAEAVSKRRSAELAGSAEGGGRPGVSLHRGLLAVFLLAGAALRVHGIADHGLWIDEYGTWWALGDGFGECWHRVLAIHGQSPLYYFLVRASVEVGGTDVFWLRLPSLLAGLGLLAVAYPMALAIFRDRHTALLVLAAVALDDRLIYYAQEARPYGLALLFAAGSFGFYAALLDGGGRGARLGWVATTVLTYYTHYLFGIVIVVQGIHLVLQRPPSLARLRAWAGPAAATGLLLVPGVFQLVPLFTRRETLDWIQGPSGPWAGLTMAVALLDPVLLGTTAVLLAIVWLSDRGALSPPSGWAGIPIVWFALPQLLYGVLAPLAGVSLMTARFVGVVWPAAALIHGMLLSLPRRRPWLRWVPPAGFVAVALATQVYPLATRTGGPFWWFHQQQWEPAVAEMARAYRPGDLILFRTGFVELDLLVRGTAPPETVGFVEWPIEAYLPEDRTFELQALPYRDTPELDRRLAAAVCARATPRRVWLIGMDPVDDTGESFHALLAMARHALPLTPIHHRRYGHVHLLSLRPADARGPSCASPRSPGGGPRAAP